jgi:hypothetical protein
LLNEEAGIMVVDKGGELSNEIAVPLLEAGSCSISSMFAISAMDSVSGGILRNRRKILFVNEIFSKLYIKDKLGLISSQIEFF